MRRVLPEERLHVGALTSLVPAERRELEETVLRPLRQQAEDVAQVRPRLHVTESAAREERREERVHGAAVVTADDEPVLAADGLAPQRKLAHVVMNGQPSVFEEARESDALILRIANAVRNGRVVEDRLGLGIAPREKRVDDVARSLLANLLFLLTWRIGESGFTTSASAPCQPHIVERASSRPSRPYMSSSRLSGM